jgi:hypothetical protein
MKSPGLDWNRTHLSAELLRPRRSVTYSTFETKNSKEKGHDGAKRGQNICKYQTYYPCPQWQRRYESRTFPRELIFRSRQIVHNLTTRPDSIPQGIPSRRSRHWPDRSINATDAWPRRTTYPPIEYRLDSGVPRLARNFDWQSLLYEYRLSVTRSRR